VRCVHDIACKHGYSAYRMLARNVFVECQDVVVQHRKLREAYLACRERARLMAEDVPVTAAVGMPEQTIKHWWTHTALPAIHTRLWRVDEIVNELRYYIRAQSVQLVADRMADGVGQQGKDMTEKTRLAVRLFPLSQPMGYIDIIDLLQDTRDEREVERRRTRMHEFFQLITGSCCVDEHEAVYTLICDVSVEMTEKAMATAIDIDSVYQ